MGRINQALGVLCCGALLAITAWTASAQPTDQQRGEQLLRSVIQHIDALEAFEIECEMHYVDPELVIDITRSAVVKYRRYPDGGFLLHVVGEDGSEAMLSPDTCIVTMAGKNTIPMFLKSNIVSSNPDSAFLGTYQLAFAPEWLTRIQSRVHGTSEGILQQILDNTVEDSTLEIRVTEAGADRILVLRGTGTRAKVSGDSLVPANFTWTRTISLRNEDDLPFTVSWKSEEDGIQNVDDFTIKSISFQPDMVSIGKRLEQLGDDFTVKIIPPQEHTPLELGAPIEWSGRYLDGDTVSSEDFKGGYVLYKFMYRGCSSCHEFIPFMKNMKDKYPNLKVVELDPYDRGDEEKMKRYIEKNEINYPLIFISREDPKRLSVKWFPVFYLVGPEGTLVWQDDSTLGPKEMAKQIGAFFEK